MHEIQLKIIKKLLYSPQLSYTSLKGARTSSDKFWFHLKQLVKAGLVQKVDDVYTLTMAGRLAAHEFDSDTLKPIVKPITVVTVAVNYDGKYLLQKRLKQPFLGYYGFPGGKVEFGDTLFAAGKRELFLETGIEAGDFKLVGIHHEMNTTQDNVVLRDAYVYILHCIAVKVPKKLKSKDGENFFINTSEYKDYEPRFRDTDDFFEHNILDLFFAEFQTSQNP